MEIQFFQFIAMYTEYKRIDIGIMVETKDERGNGV